MGVHRTAAFLLAGYAGLAGSTACGGGAGRADTPVRAASATAAAEQFDGMQMAPAGAGDRPGVPASYVIRAQQRDMPMVSPDHAPDVSLVRLTSDATSPDGALLYRDVLAWALIWHHVPMRPVGPAPQPGDPAPSACEGRVAYFADATTGAYMFAVQACA